MNKILYFSPPPLRKVRINKTVAIIIYRESLKKHNERTSALIKLKDTANESMENLTKLVKEAVSDLEKSREAFAKIGVENESLKAIKSSVDKAIEVEVRALEELQRGISSANEHSDKLKEQVNFI